MRIVGILLIGLLVGAAAPNITSETLPDNRVRITITVPTDSTDAQIEALVRLDQLAARLCHRRAVSEGGLVVNQVPGRSDRITISAIYRCPTPDPR
jgi:hypothetical protein